MVAGAAIGALGSIAGGLMSNALSTYQMQQMADYTAELNWSYAKKNAKYMPKYNRQGLERAGYNPMLALSNLSGAQTNWSQLANPTTPDLSGVGTNAVSTALAVKQQENQNRITTAQEENYNAETMLKKNQAITEMFTQLEKLNHSDLMEAQKVLTSKESSNFERAQAREDLKVGNELKRTENDFKVGMTQAVASQLSAQAGVVSAGAQSSMAGANAEEQRLRAKWIKEHPYLYGIERAGAGVAGLGAAGFGAGYGIKNMIKPKKSVGFKVK